MASCIRVPGRLEWDEKALPLTWRQLLSAYLPRRQRIFTHVGRGERREPLQQ